MSRKRSADKGRCTLCSAGEVYNRHHLIPRTVHSNKWFKKRYTRAQMAKTIPVCKGCHDMINTMDQKEVARKFNTVELLRAHPKIRKFIAWRRKRGAAGSTPRARRPRAR